MYGGSFGNELFVLLMKPIQSYDSTPQSGGPGRVFAILIIFIGLMVEKIPNHSNKLGLHTLMLVTFPRSSGHCQQWCIHTPDMISFLAAIGEHHLGAVASPPTSLAMHSRATVVSARVQVCVQDG